MRRCRLCLDSPLAISAVGMPRHGEATLTDDYLLPEHWCFHIYSYHGVLELDGAPFPIAPGYASLIPPGTRMVYRYRGPSEHVYFHFLAPAGASETDLAAIFDLGEDFSSMDLRARRAAGLQATDPAYATATLWALLCELADLQKGHSSRIDRDTHPTVSIALRQIEKRLDQTFTVSQLCREVGVSDGYLSRLFRESLGVSVLEYVRARRADQAQHLLQSTTMPIKAIARSVGVPDLQQFNRLMHKVKGASPRALRTLGPRNSPTGG